MRRSTRNGAKVQTRPRTGPEVDELVRRLQACSREAKRLILYKLLRHLLGKKMQGEVTILDSKGELYAMLISPEVWGKYRFLGTPDDWAKPRRSHGADEGGVPFREIVDKMKAEIGDI